MQSGLIPAIYDAPLAARPWTALLPELRREMHASGLMLKFSAATSQGSEILFADADWDFGNSLDQYRRVYQYKDPIQHTNMSVGGFYRFEDLIDRASLCGTEFYRLFCKPFDIHHAFFFYIGQFDGLDTWLNGSRTSQQEPFSACEMHTLRRLLPHLSRAAHIYARLESRRVESAIYSRTVSALGIGIVLLDSHGRIVSTNTRADAILAGCSPIRQLDGRLQIVGPRHREFAAIVARLADARSAQLQALSVSDESGCKVNLVLRRADDLIVGTPAIVVYIRLNAQDLSPSMVTVVGQALGLSQTEARLALLLANGHSLAEIAENLQVTETTARTYCKRALAKTGARRQTELARLVVGSLAQLA